MKKPNTGHIHPLTHVMREIGKSFSKLGFEIALGPEVETEHYNFDALNIPADHPARDMWDTFWLKTQTNAEQTQNNAEIIPHKSALDQHSSALLRTHTSPMQVRFAEGHKPPYRIIVPGKCFRQEATDATHEAQFYQFEGLVVDKNVSLANLTWTLEEFFKDFFASDSKVRLRPSYFPFTEPSVEVDVWNSAKNTWLEIMGAGLVHPKVIENFGLDSTEWSGFAFGSGIERLAMLKYGVPDVRMFYQPDLRLTNQF